MVNWTERGGDQSRGSLVTIEEKLCDLKHTNVTVSLLGLKPITAPSIYQIRFKFFSKTYRLLLIRPVHFHLSHSCPGLWSHNSVLLVFPVCHILRGTSRYVQVDLCQMPSPSSSLGEHPLTWTQLSALLKSLPQWPRVKLVTTTLALHGKLSHVWQWSCFLCVCFCNQTMNLSRVEMIYHSIMYLPLTLETRYVLNNACWMKMKSASPRRAIGV